MIVQVCWINLVCRVRCLLQFFLYIYVWLLHLRRHKEEEALQQTVWRVNLSDIVAVKRRTGSVVCASFTDCHTIVQMYSAMGF